MTLAASALASAALLCCGAGLDAAERSRAVRAEFMRANPCPATEHTRGPCPGWQVDHRTPLCNGGADRVDNLQWLSTDAHRRKTTDDIRLCRLNRTP